MMQIPFGPWELSLDDEDDVLGHEVYDKRFAGHEMVSLGHEDDASGL